MNKVSGWAVSALFATLGTALVACYLLGCIVLNTLFFTVGAHKPG